MNALISMRSGAGTAASVPREVMALMQQVVREQKKTLVMVTHDDHLAGYADRIFHIIDGKIVKVEDNRKKAGEHAEQGGNEQ